MFEFKRNHIIVTVLVFMIAIAAFLTLEEGSGNIEVPQYAQNENQVDVSAQDVDFSDDFFDDYNTMTTLPPDGDSLEDDQALETASNNVVISKKQEDAQVVDSKEVEVSYFAEEKMLREQARASQIEQLTEYVADENLDADAKAKAAENLLLIQDRIEKESGAESLLRAKGFKDVFVRMDDDTVDVVVNAEALNDSQIAQIEEIVQRKTGYSVGQIKISFLSMNNETAEN